MSGILFLAALVSVAIGPTYDKNHNLYPESVQVSYDFSIGGIYGERWRRFGTGLVVSGILTTIVSAFIWYREKQKEKKTLLGLIEEK